MKHRKSILLAYFVPLVVCVLFCAATRELLRRAKDNWRECAACARAAESLAPYLEAVRAYDGAKARLRAAGAVRPPEPPLGVPPAKRSNERGPVIDGWSGLQETFSWPSLKTGQAFAVLESFTSAEAGPWRIAELNMAALPDGENASLSVRLESAVPAAWQE